MIGDLWSTRQFLRQLHPRPLRMPRRETTEAICALEAIRSDFRQISSFRWFHLRAIGPYPRHPDVIE